MDTDNENPGSNDYPAAIVPHIGTEVTGDRFFPRKVLADAFDSAMTRTNGAKLFGLRRIGKSSEAAACCERLINTGYIVVREDAEGMTSEVMLLQKILAQLPTEGLHERVMKSISQNNSIAKTVRDFITKATGGKPDDVLAYLDPIMAAIENAIDQNEHVALIIDEFPWLCKSILQSDAAKGVARVDVLLAALRRWRSKGMRMLLMGSVGMVALGRRYGLNLEHLNDLGPLNIPPLNPDEASALVNALAVGGRIKGWTGAHTTALLKETIAFYPVMLQKGFEQTTLGGDAVKVEDFPDLFAEKVRPDFDDTYYQQFDKRRKLYRELPAPLPDLLEKILCAVIPADDPVARAALVPDGSASATDLDDALNILREDGFLAVRSLRDGTQYWRPASDLIKAWWKQRRGNARR